MIVVIVAVRGHVKVRATALALQHVQGDAQGSVLVVSEDAVENVTAVQVVA